MQSLCMFPEDAIEDALPAVVGGPPGATCGISHPDPSIARHCEDVQQVELAVRCLDRSQTPMRVGHLASAAPAAFRANLAIVGPSSMTWKRVNKPASFISR